MSSADHQAAEDAQREALQHNLAYLDVLPQDQEGSMGDTDAALNSLFGQQFDNIDEAEPEPDAGAEKTRQEMDDITVGQAAAEAELRQNRNEDQLDEERQQLGPTVQSDKLIDADGSASGTPTVKRKATSRANMLARGGACEYCKRRKLKCSAEQPKCAACARSDRECVYSQKQQKSRVRVLEDRLAELEKKLGGAAGEAVPSSSPAGPFSDSVYAAINSASASGSTGPTNFVSPLTHVPTADDDGEDTFQYSDVGLASSLDLGFTLDILGGKDADVEPDLMTLADAATHDRIQAGGKYPWDGMSAEQIVSEILSAVGGGKGAGEKIVLFLLHAYINPRTPQTNLVLFDPSTLLSRLSPRSTSPLHPSLILSIIILVISFMPATAFSPSSTPSTIASALLAPARTYSAQAYAAADVRLLDAVAGQAIRAIAFFHQGRFLDGWVETSGSAALAWACGLGKLGGVGQRFLSQGERGDRWDERCEREESLREWRYKSAVVEPPKNRKEYGERIRLFWGIYLLDRAAAVGWGWPSSFNDDEITTPWPLESYETDESLRSTSSMADFLTLTSPSEPSDTPFCSLLKTFTLLYRATRLFDSNSSPSHTREVLRVAQVYMPALAPVQRQSSAEWGVQQGPVNANWMVLHTAMALLYAKEDVDAEVSRPSAHLSKCVVQCQKVVECVELAREMGDFAFEGYDIASATVWAIVGRTVYKIADRLGREPTVVVGIRVEDVRGLGDTLVESLKVMGKRIPYAATCAQILENTNLGSEGKVGEWVRPDWTNP